MEPWKILKKRSGSLLILLNFWSGSEGKCCEAQNWTFKEQIKILNIRKKVCKTLSVKTFVKQYSFWRSDSLQLETIKSLWGNLYTDWLFFPRLAKALRKNSHLFLILELGDQLANYLWKFPRYPFTVTRDRTCIQYFKIWGIGFPERKKIYLIIFSLNPHQLLNIV